MHWDCRHTWSQCCRVLFNVEHSRGQPLMLRNFVQLKIGQATVRPKAQGSAIESEETMVREFDIVMATS